MNDTDRIYEGLLEDLFSRHPSVQTSGFTAGAYKPGLERMQAFEEALGHPTAAFRSIHIAGTNGKGSVCSMLASALAARGLRVGLYTSPHLTDFRERIKIITDGGFEMIPRDEVLRFLQEEDLEGLSFFEITTGLAFRHFAERQVDIAVIETGLGGRLDSTNVITPILSIITNIGLEHCEHLGFTLEAIAGEKAGIIKPGVPAVVGEYLPETRPVFEAKAAACGSPLTFAVEAPPCLELKVNDLDLPGDYQQRNLCTLSAAVGVLQPMLGLDLAAFRSGVCQTARRTGLHGRWETLRAADPVAGKAQIICDTGHNAHGLRWVSEQIDRISCDYENVFFVFGLAKEKDVDAIAPLLPRNVHYIWTQASSPRALPAVDLANEMHDRGLSGEVCFSVSDALKLADSKAADKDLIFIGGSNFVVCEVLTP